MKRFALIAIALFVVSCGSNPPTQPSTVAAPTFTATLSPSNEIPAIQAPESSGQGTVTVTLNVTRDANQAITAATATFVVNLTGFPANTPINLAHIHEGTSSVASGTVRVNLGLASGEVVLSNGAGSFTKTNINVPVDIANGLLNNAAGFYFNVHSQLNPGGVARGQLTRTQ